MFSRRQKDDMGLNAAIETQRTALLRIVMTLFAQIGIAPGATVFAVSRPVSLFVERVLLSAESAAFWLVVAQARAMGPASLQVGDPSGRFDLSVRRDFRLDAEDLDDASAVRAERLCARLNALIDILRDIPKHARRLVVVQQRKSAPSVTRSPGCVLTVECPVEGGASRSSVRAARCCVAVPGLDSS